MPESRYQSFDFDGGTPGIEVGNANTKSVVVPTGEVWYVGTAGVDSDGTELRFLGKVAVGITAASNPPSGHLVDTFSRAAGKAQNVTNAPAESVSLGAYAHGGETIFVTVDEPDNDCVGFLEARRVL